MERDTDVLKLQILADYYHSNYVGYLSFIFGFIIAWVVAFVSLFLQKVIDLLTYSLILLLGYVVLGLFLYYVQRTYHGNLDGVDELIQSMNKNRFEPLPSIRELRKGRPIRRTKAEQQGASAKQKIKSGLNTYITCVFIAVIIYIVVVIEDYYEKVLVANPDIWFKSTFGIFVVFFFGLVIFLLVSLSPQLRRLLFRMFGAEEDRGEKK